MKSRCTRSSKSSSERPETCHSPVMPGQHEVALAVPVLEHVVVALGQRARPDERHLAAQHVDQLRQLVEREAPQDGCRRASGAGRRGS